MVLAIAAGAATGIGVTMFFHALSIGVIGTVAPITCAGTSVPVLWGLVQGERPSVGQLLGVVLAIGGVVVIARAIADPDTTPAVNARLALILAIASAFTLGLYYVVAREASGTAPLWFAALGQIFAATPLVVLAVIRRAPVPPGREFGALVGIAMANGAGWLLSVSALSRGSAVGRLGADRPLPRADRAVRADLPVGAAVAAAAGRRRHRVRRRRADRRHLTTRARPRSRRRGA